MKKMIAEGRVLFGADHTQIIQLKEYLDEYQSAFRSVITQFDARLGTNALVRLLGKEKALSFPTAKPVELEQHVLSFVAEREALILDAFAGSGTTAHAVMRLNADDGGKRRFIAIEEGNGKDAYARTLLAPRLKAARKKEKLPGGFMFMKIGRRIDREAILSLERDALGSVICQTDSSARGRGVSRYDGKYVVAANDRGQAICLHWDGRSGKGVTSDALRGAFSEIATLGLKLPMRIYGIRCDVMETEDFTFCQLPDEVLNSLLLTIGS